MTLENTQEIEGDTFYKNYNMKTPLVKVNIRKNDSQKYESDTFEHNGVQKRHLRKLTKIEVQLQPK